MVAGTVGLLFGVMFDAAFLQPLHVANDIAKAVRPRAFYFPPVQPGRLPKPWADGSEFLNDPAWCMRGDKLPDSNTAIKTSIFI
jgi:hypothetical protein